MKLNMGCGYNKMPNYINVDAARTCVPDVVFNLEIFPWPWQNGVAETVVFNHSLEHMGHDLPVFLGIMQELYRICQHGAVVLINVPHPRHDHFIGDPSHVRAITPIVLSLFDRQLNDDWKKSGASNTPFAHYLNVNFKTEDVQLVPDEPYRTLYAENKISFDQLSRMSRELNNVISEYRFKLRVIKFIENSRF